MTQRPDAIPVTPALQLTLAMAIAGTIGVFVRESGVGALGAVFWRCAIGAAAMLAYCAFTTDRRALFGGRRDLVLVLIGGVSIVVNWVLAFAAFQFISITLMTIIYHVQPFFVLGLARIAFGERTGRDGVVWVGLAFAGLTLAVGFDPGLSADGGSLLTGVGLTLAAAFLYGVTVTAAKGITATPPQVVTLVHTLIGVALLAFLAHPDPAVLLDGSHLPWLLGLGLLHTGVVYVLMYGAYPRLPSPAIAVLTFVYPVTAIISDALVYGTPLRTGQAVGMGLIALATIAVNRRWPALPPRRGPALPPASNETTSDRA